MELPGRLIDAAQIRDQHDGILAPVVALTLQDRRVVEDRIAGLEGNRLANGDRLRSHRRGGRGRATLSATGDRPRA